MTKCDICKEKVATLFLGKINGTFVKKDKKMKVVCNNCQRKFSDKIDEIPQFKKGHLHAAITNIITAIF